MKASGKHPLPAWTMLAIPVLAVACTGGPPQAPLTSANDRSAQVRSTLTEAETAYQRGNLPLTERLLRKAYAGAPDDPDLALDLGDTLNRRQHMESARRHYGEFLERHPSASPVRLALGLTLMRLGQWDEAASQIRRVVEESPDDPVARFNIGVVLGKLGRDSEALPHLRRTAELSPTDPAVSTELGIALMRLGRLDEAAHALERSVTLNPENVPALFNLGNCYARLGRGEEARKALDRFTRASGSQEKYFDQKRLFRAAQARADSLAHEGKDDKSLEALLAYRDSLNDFSLFHQELGVAYLRLGRRDDAIAAFERAVAKDPTLTEAQADLAALYQQSGQGAKAMKARQAAARPVSSGPLPAETP